MNITEADKQFEWSESLLGHNHNSHIWS